MNKILQKNITTLVIVGAARSGTKMVANFLARHPAVCLQSEQNHIWRVYQQHLNHDALDVLPKAVEKIQGFYSQILKEQHQILVEKTAANCFRLPLVHAVFPSMKIIHVERDGRDVACSAALKWQNKPSPFEQNILQSVPAISKKQKRMLFRFWQWFKYDTQSALKQILFKQKSALWGPIPPNFSFYLQNHQQPFIAGYQWFAAQKAIHAFVKQNPTIPYLNLRYHNLINNPEESFAKLMAFAGFESSYNWQQNLAHIKPGNTNIYEKYYDKNTWIHFNKLFGEFLTPLD